MFYSELVKKACEICFEAHKEDKDKAGYPYVFHPFYVASQLDSENEVIVALLHDVLEDHGDTYSFDDLAKYFSEEIIEALRLLTHQKDVPYMEYVHAISKNVLARKVKIEDLKHNLDIRRTNGMKTKKYDLYQHALEYLEKGN
ncbi:MAG: GTP pyrophosphokinase [Bacillota bacterium]|nr:GTP pyrophosphokinase [Bacillota bacterium]